MTFCQYFWVELGGVRKLSRCYPQLNAPLVVSGGIDTFCVLDILGNIQL